MYAILITSSVIALMNMSLNLMAWWRILWRVDIKGDSIRKWHFSEMHLLAWYLLSTLSRLTTAQDPYRPKVHLSLANDNPKFRTPAIARDLEVTIFIPKNDSAELGEAFATVDFEDYSLSTKDVDHLLNKGYVSMFLVYNGGSEYPGYRYAMGVTQDEHRHKCSVYEDECCRDCLGHDLTGDVGTWFSSYLKWWVSFAIDKKGYRGFSVSSNLVIWEDKWWLHASDQSVLDRALEVFAIHDESNEEIWIIVYMSKATRRGLTKLMYGIAYPSDTWRRFQSVGVLDHSPDWDQLVLVSGDSYNSSVREAIVIKSGDYRMYNVTRNKYITGWGLYYQDGVLRRAPVQFTGRSIRYNLMTVGYKPGGNPFSQLLPSVVFRVEGVFAVPDKGARGFRVFVKPEDESQFGVSVTMDSLAVTVERFHWLPYGMEPVRNEYSKIVAPFEADNGTLHLQVVVDVCIVEFFAGYGLHSGSVFAFPDRSWDRYRLYSTDAMTVHETIVIVAYFDEMLNKARG